MVVRVTRVEARASIRAADSVLAGAAGEAFYRVTLVAGAAVLLGRGDAESGAPTAVVGAARAAFATPLRAVRPPGDDRAPWSTRTIT
jgi:hypothetical protein